MRTRIFFLEKFEEQNFNYYQGWRNNVMEIILNNINSLNEGD